jgi:hypothetical protein
MHPLLITFINSDVTHYTFGIMLGIIPVQIMYILMSIKATTGNATDFGNLTVNRWGAAACSGN